MFHLSRSEILKTGAANISISFLGGVLAAMKAESHAEPHSPDVVPQKSWHFQLQGTPFSGQLQSSVYQP